MEQKSVKADLVSAFQAKSHQKVIQPDSIKWNINENVIYFPNTSFYWNKLLVIIKILLLVMLNYCEMQYCVWLNLEERWWQTSRFQCIVEDSKWIKVEFLYNIWLNSISPID